jgi:HEAT repeat protein
MIMEDEMSYLWPIDELSKLTRSSEPKVKTWACERLKTLYGKAGTPALEGLLKERDEDVLREALDYLLEYPAPQFADVLLDIYRRETGHMAGRAAMILAKLKDDRVVQAFFDKEVDMDREGLQEFLEVCKALGESRTEAAFETLKTVLNQAGEKSDPVNLKTVLDSILSTGNGVDSVLDYYFRHYKDLGKPVISALLDYCRFQHSNEYLSEGKKKFFKKGLPPVVENAVSILKSNAEGKIGKELERLFRKEDYSGVIRAAQEYADNLLKETAEHVGEKAFSEWKSRDSQPRTNYNLITALNNLPSPSKEAGKGLAMVAIASLAGLEEMKFLIGLSKESAVKTLIYSFLEDREDTVDDKWIEDVLLGSPEKDAIIDETLRIISLRPHSLGAKRGIRLLALMGDERAIPCLIEIIGGKIGDFEDRAIDAAISGLARFGEKALPALEKLLEGSDEDAISEIFFVLKDIPVKRTEELLIRNWDHFIDINRELFTTALEGVASKEFIPLLRKEIKEDELIEAEVFHLLCLIHGEKDPLLPGIEKQLKGQGQARGGPWRRRPAQGGFIQGV